MLSYRLLSKDLAALQKRTTSAAQADEVAIVAARAMANVTKDHLFALDSRGNKLGGKRTHFYSDAAKSVSNPSVAAGRGWFSITKLGLAQRWLGGTIAAGRGTSSATGTLTKYLAIPARSEAYGQPPSAFDDLQFVPRGNGKAMLVEALQTEVSISGRKKKTVTRGSQVGGLVMYWLVPEVTQAPDPTVMPTEQELTDAAVEAGGEYLSRRIAEA